MLQYTQTALHLECTYLMCCTTVSMSVEFTCWLRASTLSLMLEPALPSPSLVGVAHRGVARPSRPLTEVTGRLSLPALELRLLAATREGLHRCESYVVNATTLIHYG